jgi:hypothetical protein
LIHVVDCFAEKLSEVGRIGFFGKRSERRVGVEVIRVEVVYGGEVGVGRIVDGLDKLLEKISVVESSSS